MADTHRGRCECEHDEHFSVSEQHAFGEKRMVREYVTLYGSFNVCDNCAKGHWQEVVDA